MLLEDAIAHASALHAGQVDKGGKPYILHVLRVMQAVEHFGQDHMIAAVLHDVVEDTTESLDDLRLMGASEAVVAAVDALSRRDGEVYREFIWRVSCDPIATVVKLADLEDNMNIGRLPRELRDEAAHRNARYGKARDVLLAAIGRRELAARAAGVRVVEVEG